MPQGFRYCTAHPETLEVVSLHHTSTRASHAATKPCPPLRVFKFPRPWALSVGDTVPLAGVEQTPDPPRRRARKKRLGE